MLWFTGMTDGYFTDHPNVITTDCDNMENDIIAANNASLDRIKAVAWSRVKEAPYLTHTLKI